MILFVRITETYLLNPSYNHTQQTLNSPSALGLALRHSVSEILVLFVFLFVAVLFFATVGYYSESMSNASESDFTR